MAQFPATMELSSLDGSNGFQINGEVANDFGGYSVSSAGDVNGDGFDDLIIGAHGVDANGTSSGASYVVFGTASGLSVNFELSGLTGSNGFQINGEAAGDYAGFSVSGAGDVNGDGFADLIIGAYGVDKNGSRSGASYVVFGKTSAFGPSLELSSLDGTNGFQINGEAADDNSGLSVSTAGDVNGDGFADLIIGAYNADPNGARSGASYVVFGKASAFAANFELSSLDGTNGFQVNGESEGHFSGRSVSSAGDVNGDGFADLIIGAPNSDPHGAASGASYVVFGKASGFTPSLELSSLNGANGFQISGETSGDISGYSVSSAGDVNGDGFADLIIGAPNADPHGASSGASYVVFGKASAFGANFDLSSLDGTNGFQISGEAGSDFSGFSVSAPGDVNSDGFDDLLLGAHGADLNGTVSGSAYVVFGKASGFSANFDLSSADGTNAFQMNGETAGDYSGRSVSSAGDVNGDGIADFIIGGPGADPHGSRSGAGHVVFGHKPDMAVVRTGTNAADILAGSDLNDTLLGLGGNDKLFGNGGDDKLDGGTGSDTASYAGASGGITVNLNFGQQTIGADQGADTLTSIENTIGSGFADLLVGDSNANDIDAGGGNDTVLARGGNDTLSGGTGNDVLEGGTGDDTLDGGPDADTATYTNASSGVTANLGFSFQAIGADQGADTFIGIENLTGSGFADLLVGDGSANVLDGGGGNDTLLGRGGNDTLIGATGDDMLDGGTESDTVSYAGASAGVTANLNFGAQGIGADQGSDTFVAIENLTGSSFSDLLVGDDNANVLDARGGNDALLGRGGSDTLIGGIGDDILDGGTEIDTVTYAGASAGVTADLSLGLQAIGADQGSDTLIAIENLTGSSFSDLLFGDGNANTLSGGAGDDTLSGRAGNDTLTGGLGIDSVAFASPRAAYTIARGAGQVVVSGADGTDTATGIEKLVFSDATLLTASWTSRTDFNANVTSDLLWQSDSGQAAVWLIDGTAFTSGSGVGPNPGMTWHVKGAGDFDGDGKADILWQNDDGTPVIWFMNGTTFLSGGVAGFNPGTAWKVIGTGDFNGDAKADILWQNTDGTPAVWLMNGTTLLAGAAFVNVGTAWHALGTGDFNGDAKSDILWQHNDGTPAVWLIDGTTFTGGSGVGDNPGPTWHVKAGGDFNGDGKSDILWQNDDGTPVIWFIDGTSFAGGAQAHYNPGAAWKVKNAGDFDGNGKADISWQNDNGTPAVWLMNGATLLSGNAFVNPGTSWHVLATGS